MSESLVQKLQAIRQQAANEGTDKLGSHQLDAHWSLAYACGKPPETWEIYRVPSLHLMPSTDFYVRHAPEVQEALKPTATWELLHQHAIPKLALAASMSEEDRKSHGYPGQAQYYNTAERNWLSLEVPSVRWFDGREITRESLMETAEELKAKVVRNLERYREAATKDPSAKRLETLAGYEKFVREGLPQRLRRFAAEKAEQRRWLAKLDKTPDFGKALFKLLREAENEVRKSRGIPSVGEAWVSETELLYRIRQLLPGIEVVAHGQPKWLGRQHVDIWIPSMAIAVEYHGLQHFRPVEFFGGDEALRRGQERDDRKRELCRKNGLRLVEIAYDQDVDDAALAALLLRPITD